MAEVVASSVGVDGAARSSAASDAVGTPGAGAWDGRIGVHARRCGRAVATWRWACGGAGEAGRGVERGGRKRWAMDAEVGMRRGVEWRWRGQSSGQTVVGCAG